MRDDPFENLTSTRRSRLYYTDVIDDLPLRQRLHDNAHTGFYEHMFIEDVSQLLPWGRGIDDGFTVTITKADPQVSDLIRNALPTRYGPARTLEDGIRAFMEHSAQLLMMGPATYEIDFLHKPDVQAGAPVAFRLEPIPPRSVDYREGQPIQYVPRGAGKHVADNGLSYVRLDAELLITIELASNLDRTVRRAMTIFEAADAQRMVPVTMLSEGQHVSTGFDFAAHRTETERVLLASTREIGWTGRGLFADGVLDPYAVWRHLRFLRFKIAVRDTILCGLDAAINQAGQVMGFAANVTISGLIRTEDVEAAEADLNTGRRPLSELINLGV